MNRKIVIRKDRSVFITAVLSAAGFTLLAGLFLFFSKDTGGINNPAFWVFLVIALIGWYMSAGAMKAELCVTDEGISWKGLTGNEQFVRMDEIRRIGMRKSFFFVYGNNNHILTSMEADLSHYEEACDIFRDHGIPLENRDPKKLIK
jgi:hypothetical protein